MITSLKEEKNIRKIRDLLDSVDKIVAITHTGPDGDAIGSTTAFRSVMQRLGKTVNIIIPDMMLLSLRSVPGAKEVTDATRHPDFAKQLIEEAELIVCFDFNDLKRIGKLGALVEKSSAPKILIDHHENPGTFADVMISRPDISSTCFLLFRVLCALEMFDYIDKDAATSMLTGMMTDTGNFSYNCSDPEIYVVLAELIRKGADKEKIYKEQFATHSYDCLKLNSYAILNKMDVFSQYGCAVITLSRNELNQFHYTKGDTEGLVNRPLEIPGVEVSLFLREEDGFVKASMRTTDRCRHANNICNDLYGGGGHDKAAGGEFNGTLSECVEQFKLYMPEIKKKYFKESRI